MDTYKGYSRLVYSVTDRSLVIFLTIVLFFDFFLFPLPILAAEELKEANIRENIIIIEENGGLTRETQDELNQNISHLPENKPANIIKTGRYVITAYNSERGQTDGSPCITANGFNVCQHGVEDTIAANFLPFGAKVKIPELFGEKVFVVRDRMNLRHSHRIDVWMLQKADARKFGVKIAKIEVLE